MLRSQMICNLSRRETPDTPPAGNVGIPPQFRNVREKACVEVNETLLASGANLTANDRDEGGSDLGLEETETV